MLTPDQIAGFFLHEDALIRDHAIRSLAEAHHQGPANAELLWQVINRYPTTDAYGSHYYQLQRFPHTDVSVQQTIAALATATDENQIGHFSSALEALPPAMLGRYREAILAAPNLSADAAERIRLRLDQPAKSAEELWQELLGFCQDNREVNWWDKYDHAAAARLVEQMAQHGDFAAARAMEILADASITDDREIYAAVLLGKLRWEPAVDELVKRLICDGDVICEEASRALAAIGTPSAVAGIGAQYEQEDIEYRGYMNSLLGNINIPESEALLLKLLRDPRFEDEASGLAISLCDLCSQEVLPQIIQMVEADNFDSSLDDPEHLVVAVAAMTGYEFSDAAKWRRRVGDRQRRSKERLSQMDLEEAIARMAKSLRTSQSDEFPSQPITAADFAPPDDSEPFVRAEPKVGRNDPCPCGSGKKYKKCCG